MNKPLYDMTVKCLNSVWEYPVQLLLIAENQPYTVNVNNGLRAATGEIIIIANNDLVFYDGWLFDLTQLLSEGYDITTCWTSDQKVELEDGVEEDAKFGSLFAMTRKAFKKLGYFDEQFGGYFSDLDYRRRAMELGLKIGKNLNMVVEHKAQTTYRYTDPEHTEFQRSKLLYEAKWGFIE